MLSGVYLKDLLRQCSLKEIYFLGNGVEKIATEIKTNTYTHKEKQQNNKRFYIRNLKYIESGKCSEPGWE